MATLNLIQVQERYISRCDTAMSRWSHRKDGGHGNRTRRAAYREALRSLVALGFTEIQARQLIADAQQMLELERLAND
jgi:Holliday junction resolvasome RuvABC DNA-binding subunit